MAETWDGLKCPKCGATRLEVKYTRRRKAGVLRSRVCMHCGRRILTLEQPIAVTAPPIMTAKEAGRLKKSELTRLGVVVVP